MRAESTSLGLGLRSRSSCRGAEALGESRKDVEERAAMCVDERHLGGLAAERAQPIERVSRARLVLVDRSPSATSLSPDEVAAIAKES